MLVISIILQTLVYLCSAVCVGTFILSCVPRTSRPDIYVPLRILVMAIIGIAIFSFYPLLQNILLLSDRIGTSVAIRSVLFTFETGKAWMLTLVVSIILSLFVLIFKEQRRNKGYGFVGLALSLLILLTLGWGSHASSIDRSLGFALDSLHLIAMSVWVGVLIVVSWFSTNLAHWLKFLKWYTPVALCCLFVTILTGFLLMNFMVEWEAYTTSWLVPYGQGLLWKHLLIIPLLLYATINGIFIKSRLKTSPSFNPRPWSKVESVVILLIFAATAALGEQAPPKEVTLNNETISSLFSVVYQGEISPNIVAIFDVTLTNLFLFILAFLFLLLSFLAYARKAPAFFSFLMSICFVVTIYLSLMLSVVIA